MTYKKGRLVRFRQQLRPNVARAVDRTTANVLRDMQRFAAEDTGELRDSMERVGDGLEQGVVARAPHAFAQEYGRPDLDKRAAERSSATGDETPGYTYTPYARPAAEAQRSAHVDGVAAAVRRSVK